uniref:Essential protein Yae1 N-terminal domain-containing protein n=1 Tax=Eptatretus burgeri TaxID=7764 RepID=A0A8C4QMU2_EPTBU
MWPFDEAADELVLERVEWRRIMSRRVEEGYRDGAHAGREWALQRGFNIGFAQGAATAVGAKRLEGVLGALLAWTEQGEVCPALAVNVRHLHATAIKLSASFQAHLLTPDTQPIHPAELGEFLEAMDIGNTSQAEPKLGTRRHSEQRDVEYLTSQLCDLQRETKKLMHCFGLAPDVVEQLLPEENFSSPHSGT